MTKREEILREDITLAEHSAKFTTGELQNALGKSTRIEYIVILPLISRAAELRRDISQLLEAIK